MRMTTEEAFVKVLQMHGIEHAFGIIGSAFMPISDLFPKAGITFWDCAHEGSGGMMADGYTRASGKMSMMIAQNGPGITNFVTPVKTAYWNHTPLLLVTPQAANRTIGQGGFQEVEQMALFKDMVCYQEEVRDPNRVAEVLNRVIMNAKRLSAPAQINMPRDFWTQVIDIELPAVVAFERPSGGEEAIAAAAKLLSEAKFPVILNGAGNPFSTLPGYGIDYWPKDAAIIQVDMNPSRIGLTKPITVGIVGDAGLVSAGLLRRLPEREPDRNRLGRIAQAKSAWAQQLASMDHEEDDPGTTWNQRARQAKPDWMSPRMAWRAIQAGLPARCDHLQRHRQQLRHRQCLSVLRERGANISRPDCSVPVATVFRRSSARRSVVRTRWSSASRATGRSASA